MIATITLDKAGRVVLPKPVRDELELSPGDSLEISTSEDEIILRPARSRARMYKKHGVWVLHGGEPLAADVVEKTLQKARRERERRILGKLR
jgi:AbrB family looped-hinge helix DNA binding protein